MSFYDNTKDFGGQITITAKYYFKNNFTGFIRPEEKPKAGPCLIPIYRIIFPFNLD
jgi:hypothetical protein